MKVKEVISMLEEFYPEDEVIILTDSGRVIQILGVNRLASQENGCIVLRSDWSVIKGKIVETDAEREAREKFLDRETTSLTGAKDLVKKKRTTSVKPKKRGRPKKRRPKLPESKTYE